VLHRNLVQKQSKEQAMKAAIAASAILLCASCQDSNPPTSPTGNMATVRFDYAASTVLRSDLTDAQKACASAVEHTHIHPSWRNFDRIDMEVAGSDLWRANFSDAPVNVRLSIRISDGNACVQNATGAATRNVSANGVLLSEIVPTPGSGTEPGLAFTVDARGRVTP
jgi:hypothetical protein